MLHYWYVKAMASEFDGNELHVLGIQSTIQNHTCTGALEHTDFSTFFNIPILVVSCTLIKYFVLPFRDWLL